MTEFVVIVVPPEGHPKTFKDQQATVDPATGEVGTVEVERPYFRHITVNVKDEAAARRLAERQARDLARQEVEAEGSFNDDPDGKEEAIDERMWVVDTVTDQAKAAAEQAKAEAASSKSDN